MSIDMNEATALRKEWQKKKEGQPSLRCDHPHIERETYIRGNTLDYACTSCGELFSRTERDELLRSRGEDPISL